MNADEIEAVEIGLLLEAIFQRYGFDFRSYARASIERRVRGFVAEHGLAHVADLLPRVLHDPAFFDELAQRFSIGVTEMFRDPFFYRAFREKVVPLLRTYPLLKVWHAGCATGEEVYSLAIVLSEEGLLGRATIFGTDFNERALEQARQGIYPVSKAKDFTRSYQEAGGKGSFSEYYTARYGSSALTARLRERITFASHNLATDTAFGEMHVVCCRNVLIYFDRSLQERALTLFHESLVRGGFLCLGTREDIRFSSVADGFEVVDRDARIYRKKVAP